MQNGQDNPITNRVQKMDAFPGTLKWSSFCFTIPDDSYNNQIRIVEGSPEGMGKDVPQLASFVNGAWSGNTDMAGDSSRGRELAKQVAHPLTILRDLWIHFRVGSFEVHVREDRRSTVSWPSEIDHIEIMFLDESI